MEYNSERGALIMPEHGRHIQKMINYALSIEDREQRNKVANDIVEIMGQLNPHLRDYEDFRHKLWDHLFIISKFKLDVDSPYTKLDPNIVEAKAERLTYPPKIRRLRHYGRFLVQIIEKVKEMPEGPNKIQMVTVLANFMKKQYLTYNREAVEDEQILNDLLEMSGGALTIENTIQLHSSNSILFRKNKGVSNGKFHNNNNNRKNKNQNQNQKNRKR